ncbi:transposase [Chryseobacterium sp. NFX27]|uniref:transposase n=1 Tax=Chryseobacterium sp. NFX27 TaxID=2819618 RepID=UPI003CF3BE66
MEEHLETAYIKRTQRDYNLSLKLQIVREIEAGKSGITECRKKYGIQARSTIVSWLRKYGTFDWENQTSFSMKKTPEQRIMELEAEVKEAVSKGAVFFCVSKFAIYNFSGLDFRYLFFQEFF